ncbi:MAG: CDP-glycerol glycerophosphotransferase family protein [Balneolales bacterium]|nr:CDP-glycerol glycerophosphotransferase family protein [Balneolales bacterium]
MITDTPKTFYPIQWLAGLLSAVLPRFLKQDSDKIVLTAFHGDGYRGNTRVIFEKLISENNAKVIWLTRNPVLFKKLVSKFGTNHVCMMHSWAGLKHLATAKAILLTHGTSDFAFLKLPRRAAIIQTYHGLPTKKGEYMRPGTDEPPGYLHRKILEYRFGSLTHFLSSSSLVSYIFGKRFNLHESAFVQTGYPMYDHLVNTPKSKQVLQGIFPNIGSLKGRNEPMVIMYAPTYRRRTKTRWFPFDDVDLTGVKNFLEKLNAVVLFRPHPNDKFNFGQFSEQSDRFVLADHKIAESVEELLPAVDLILTDYSSIYLEGLLLDIPSVFIPYDKNEYERGMPLPYEEVITGPQVSTQKGLLETILAISEQPDLYNEKMEQVRKSFFEYQSGDAAGRVIEFINTHILKQPSEETMPLSLPNNTEKAAAG